MDGDTKYVVIVDDEPNILSSLRRELRPWADSRGYTIQPFLSAGDTLEFLERNAQDTEIVISDLRMPGMKGSDLLLRVRSSWPEIPTILLSGYSEAEELAKAVKAGIFSYILKPWDPEHLKAELEKALDMRRLREQNAAYAKRLDEELRWAGQFQRNFLKPTSPDPKGLEVRVTWNPVEGLYCGGDYYDVLDLGERGVLLLLGDVAGHGIKAALFTGFLKAMIYPEYVRATADRPFSPGAFLKWLNHRVIYELRAVQGMIVSFLAVLVDPAAGAIRYANAGHPRPILVGSGTVSELQVAGPALCFSDPMDYQEGQAKFGSDDTLFLHTDGLVEAGNAAGAGEPRLAEALGTLPYGEGYHEAVLATCLERSGQTAFSDDVTIITARMGAS